MQTLKFLKVTIPQGLKTHADAIENECRGAVYVSALQAALKQKGKSACESIEVSLQISRLDLAPEDQLKAFQSNYRKTCPGRYAGSH